MVTKSFPRKLASSLGFRVLVGFGILYAAVYLVRLIMGVGPNLLMRYFGASADFRAFVGSTLNYGVGIASYILFSAIAIRRLLDLDPWPRFFPVRRGWWQDLLGGLLLVALVLSLLFLAELGAGWLSIADWNWNVLSAVAWLRVAWVGLLVNVGVAIGEETVFRGYLLAGLKQAWGKWPGLLAMTVIFGIFHLPAYLSDTTDPGPVTLSILLASAFGLLFGLVYLQTGTLWLPVALHFAWNFIDNDLLNLSADTANPNLVGALTTTRLEPIVVVLLEALAFTVIALGLALWKRSKGARDAIHEAPG